MIPWFLTLLSGVLTTALFPPFDLWPLAAAALVPLFSAVWQEDWHRAWRTGWVYGLVFFGSLLYWLAPTISRFGNIPIWAAIPVIGLLVCYLAFFPALWAGISAYLSTRLCNRFFAGLVVALLWGSLEWLRGWLLSGFPWGSLAYALAPQPLLFQSADIWGPYAISAILVFINFLLYDAVANMDICRGLDVRFITNLLCVLVICGGTASYGVIRYRAISGSDPAYPSIRAAAIQGSLPQEMKWAPGLQRHTVNIYQRLTLQAARRLSPSFEGKVRPQGLPDLLVVWPETAMPFFFQQGGELADAVKQTAREVHGAILFGTPAFDTGPGMRRIYFNRACLVDDQGRLAGTYDKMHLVPFGEYLPWGPLTSWARRLVPAAGDFTAGNSAAPLSYHQVRAGVLICFESIFPGLARKRVIQGANCLVVITNDSWFGDTGAPYQHAEMAAFRAVEQRRWVIRAANTGVSEIISPTGQVVAKSSLFRQDIVTGTIRLRDDATVYQRVGDIPLLLLTVVLSAVSGCLARRPH